MPFSVRINCPHCKAHSAITPAAVEQHLHGHPPTYEGAGGNAAYSWWMGACNNEDCREPVLIRQICNVVNKVLPTPQADAVSNDVPEPMKSDLFEARVCVAAGAFNASVTMARRALQQSLRGQRAEGRLLTAQIDDAARQQIITPTQRAFAHSVRWVGNVGAHGAHEADEAALEEGESPHNVTLAEAEAVLDLLSTLFHSIYEVPAKRARLELNRR